MTNSTQTITLANGRSYLLTPGSGPRSPVVVFLHGTGGTAAWVDTETGWSALARRAGFVLLLPDALPPDPRKPPKFLTNPARWNDGGTRPGDSLHSDADDVAFLASVIADAIARTGADPNRVCVSGFSNGAGMAFRFAAERADLIAAIAPVAGHCWPSNPRPSRPVPTLYVIGTADPLIPLAGGPVRLPWMNRSLDRPTVDASLTRWATALGCNPQPLFSGDTATYPGPVEFRAIYLPGHGHHWPGGHGLLGPKIGGPISTTLNGCEVVWQFFQQY